MAAPISLLSEDPTPTPITEGRDISSLTRACITVVARSMISCGSAGRIAPSGATLKLSELAVQLPPTKPTVPPIRPLSALSTAPIGLPIVVVLLPAKRRATGWWQLLLLLLTIREPESPPALKLLLLMTT